MPNSKIFEGKTTNEAIEKGLKEFHVSKDKVEIKIIEEEKRSFFSILDPRVVKIEMTLKEGVKEEDYSKKETVQEEVSKEELEEIKGKVEVFLKELIEKLPAKDLEYKVDYENSYITVDITGKDVNYLIGYRGDVLNSLQTILSSFITNITKHKVRAILDIGNYKEKRKTTLENLAERTASNVIRTGKKITLEPMTPYERKIIHSKLQENSKIKTYSVGEEPYRKIVISLN